MENENNVIGTEANIEVVAENKRKSKNPIVIGATVVVLIIIGVIVTIILSMFSPSAKYNKANNLIGDGKYDEAIAIYQELGDYEDSSQKIIECNRRKLYDYCKNKGITDLTNTGSTYGIKTEGEKINFYMIMSSYSANVEFGILMDMTSDDGEFYTSFGSTASGEGTFKVSEFSDSKNNLSLESYSGIVSRSQILDMSTMSSMLLGIEITPLLEKTELGLVAKDIGFISVEK